ncbi:aminoglycoside 3-N-acetyltransferase [Catalinimonas alkaloidigena]|uniref:AAC(3) family N-acetyltransferase n=1 Tax=Catalinimonas alkaloidigena TaxID=1075417 RepID=UPI002406938E|nr:AAC(3) family N-acetyltransferase [Catalinimonas alkaloidigena]MDF9799463.1 aminoglycoside 3-N-acetyltransferase [Catalinimonas alkaloidigena]
MYSREDLIQDIESLGVDAQGTLLIHSSMKAIGEVEGGAETVLDAFIAYMKDGLLIFPTHTWHKDNNKDGIYNPLTEPSCVGILSNLFMQRPGVVRSLHPSHSIAALGKDAEAYTEGEEKSSTPCPREGCWGKLYDRDAQILFLGCSTKSNTYIHSVEEWCDVPERLTEDYHHYRIIKPDGAVVDYSQRNHSKKYGDVSRNYDKLLKPSLYHGIIREGKIGDAASYLCDARPMAELTLAFLKRAPNLFLDDTPIPEDWYR